MAHTYQTVVGDKVLSVETGVLAEQAGGAVTVRYGDSVVLVTACASAQRRDGIDFIPLTVDYEERLYAAGKIPGSFFRREGRPSQEGVLAARLTDRPLRPLFPKGLRNEVQVIVTVLSADQENPPEVLSIIGASAALSLSEVPFEGPVAATRVGYLDGEYIINPTFRQLQDSQLDLIVAGTQDAVMMVEAGAKEVAEEVTLEAIRRGQEVNQEVNRLQTQMVEELGKPKREYASDSTVPPELEGEVSALLSGRLEGVLDRAEAKGERNAALTALESEVVEKLAERYDASQVAQAFNGLLKRVLRTKILREHKRPDGRGPRDIRPISCQVGILPRTHGSGLFTRGQTQVLTIATLGSVSEKQNLDTLSPEESKRFMHHYNFPPFSTGEVRRVGSPRRRDVGHGALAERALMPVLPNADDFPYTVRLVSEVLSSNGSTSMGSVCGSTLALMDAGVPIARPVAGVAMGLVRGEDGAFVVLTDIQGTEDSMGDMDFKVAGTQEGITALQMDIKVRGITYEVMREALEQALEGRLFILDRMREAIGEVRPNLSPYAPRMLRMSIPTEKIGAVIGPGGRVIRAIVEETGATIDVENDGTVTVGSSDEDKARQAVEAIERLVKDVEVGEVYTGKVTRLMNFGAFVEILPGKEGLVHISELADYRVPSVEDAVKVNDEVQVMVIEVDRMGRINLSRRAVLEGVSATDARTRVSATRNQRNQEERGPRRGMGPGGGDRWDGPPPEQAGREGGFRRGGPPPRDG